MNKKKIMLLGLIAFVVLLCISICVFKKQEFTVVFDSMGGSVVDSQIVKEGNKVNKPKYPIKEGLIFSGWTLNGEEYDFNNIVKEDITLVATWKECNYIIKITPVDQFSPDRVLTVYEKENIVDIKKIMYNDGEWLCDGENPTVSTGDIVDEIYFKVELMDGKIVDAMIN